VVMKRYITDEEIDLTEIIKRKYIISSQHRKIGNPNKSIWKISFRAEVKCFIWTISENWINQTEAWGVKIDKTNTLEIVGLNDNGERLKIAKFVDGNGNDVWHGYPADYMNKTQDRPTTTILKVWVDNGYISKSKMSKIRRGQPCNL